MEFLKLFYGFLLLQLISFLCVTGRPSDDIEPIQDTFEDWSNRRFVLMTSESGFLHVVDLLKPAEPLAISPSDITLYMFTRTNREEAEIITNLDINQLEASGNYNPNNMNVLVTHGWTGAHGPKTIIIKDALLSGFDVNVFVVDWSGPAGAFYTTAKASVPEVAAYIADFIKKMYALYNLTGDRFRMTGHSLGGQLIGFVGKHLNGKIDAMIAIDPAGPGYKLDDPETRLNNNDAKYVEVVHGNAGMLGFKDPIGDADYYPNGGAKQPGCGLDIAGTCAHSIVISHVAEGLMDSKFVAKECETYKQFANGDCDGNKRGLMAQFKSDDMPKGKFYLDTAGNPPYGLGEK